MIRCSKPGCPGVVEQTGFCDTCGYPPQLAALPPAASSDSTTRPSQFGAGSDLLSLPVFEFPDPSSRILSNPEVPERDRKCGNCSAEVGRSYAEQPALSEGYCQQCRQPYSFQPSLRDGDLVAGQYKIIGCFARGGLGWVYLARDVNLDDNLVVLKGLIDAGDAALAAAERRALTMMDHPNIVRIFNFVTHPDPHTKKLREYIVMEYVDGLVLSDVQKQSAAGGMPLGEPLRVEHVIVCGLQILAAFDYLHTRQLLYCDMSPNNVIVRSGQHGARVNRVKLIDLGAVRKVGDRISKITGTAGFQVERAEIDDRGLTVQSDIHALGVTLDHLFQVTVDRAEQRAGNSPVIVGLESFRRVLERATHGEADRRFTSAAQMAEQLRGVHREIASLRDGNARPEESTVFTATAALLDAGLGSVPPLERWLRDDWSLDTMALLTDGMPTPVAAAVGLPMPQVNPDDPAAGFLTAAAAPDPRRLLDKLSAYEYHSVEVQLARCRAQLELGEFDQAAASAQQACRLLGYAADNDWRIRWHQGLLALVHDDVDAAQAEFDAVYGALPGEEAPKLALGYCAEILGDRTGAEERYRAVLRRNRLQASAAFGLARLRLSHGDRADAVRMLDAVPKISRHADAAAIARVIVLCGDFGSGQPTVEDLCGAANRLPETYLDGGDSSGDSRDRLTAVVREAAFWWTRANGRPLPAHGGAVFGNQPGENALREALEQSYRALARQARDADSQGVLVDLANTIRPTTFR